jgi:tRNA threonylcarbamoyl adenosine modification protein (Sua5/YciO/YrdC/YwlC family)
MAQYFEVHPVNPQPRLIRQAVDILRGGGVIAYPTDSSYALGCQLGDKDAMERIRNIRQVDKHHNFTLVCADLSQLAQYARVGNSDFRLLKAHTPGPYTFILEATREVPRRLQHEKRKTIGLRVPDHPVVRALLAELGEPIASSTLILPGETLPLSDPLEIRARLERQLDLVIDAGPCSLEPTTVVVLEDGVATVQRVGRGDPAPFGG